MKKTFMLCLAGLAAAFALNSCENVPAPYEVPNTTDGSAGSTAETTTNIAPTGEGTIGNPYNVAAILQKVKAMAADVETERELYVKGIVTNMSNRNVDDVPKYGNITFDIADAVNGAEKIKVYQSYYLNKQKYTSADQVKVGDSVIVCAKWTNYKGNTPETIGRGNAYLYAHNGKTGSNTPDQPGVEITPTGDGTEANPYNIAAILDLVSKMPVDQNGTKEVYVKGKISRIKGIYASSYGNADYYLVDEGSNKEFYVFRSMSFEGQKFTNEHALKAGDIVVLRGLVVNFKGNTPETVPNKSCLISVNGKKAFEDTPHTPNVSDTTDIRIAGSTITMLNGTVTAGTETLLVDLDKFGFKNAQDITEVKYEGCTITFDKGTNTNNTPKFYTATHGVRMYANNIVSFTAAKNIARITLACDVYQGTNCIGNETRTFKIDGNVFHLTNTHTEPSGGVQLRIKTVTFTFAQ